MEVKKLAKEWRVWVLGISLILSLALMAPSPVDSNDDGTWDSYRLQGLNGSMGIDFTGGSQLVLEVETNDSRETTNEVVSALRGRINNLNIPATSVERRVEAGEQRIYLESAASRQRVQNLISQQRAFEAYMPFIFQEQANFSLGETYTFRQANSSVEILSNTEEGQNLITTLGVNESDEVGGTKIRYAGQTDQDYARMEVIVYDNADIESVDRTSSAVRRSGTSSYRASIPLIVTQESKDRMQNVANNFAVSGGTLVMENGQPTELTILLGGQNVNNFTVSSDFQQGTISQPTINLNGNDQNELRERMNNVEDELSSGNLPEPVVIVSSVRISETLGSQFMTASVLSIVGSLIAVGLLIFLRYKNPKLVFPIVFTGASEVFILLGMWFTNFATLNLSAIAGIIAAVGTGVDDQIIITDESETESIKDWKARMKTAFFVIFTSAASTIGAMTPILSPQFSTLMVGLAGLGLLGYSQYSSRTNNHYIAVGILAIIVSAVAYQFPLSALYEIQEFATTTIIGILIGITITRPAFAKFLENMDN